MHFVLVLPNHGISMLYKDSWPAVHAQPDGSVRCKGLFLLFRQLVVDSAAAVWLRLQAAVELGSALSNGICELYSRTCWDVP
jgi:hypothetical protein